MIVNLHLRGFTITMETLLYMSLWDCFQKSVTKEKWATPMVGSRLSKKEGGHQDVYLCFLTAEAT